MRWLTWLFLSIALHQFAEGTEVTCSENEDTIRLTTGDRVILVYNKRPTSDASEQDPAYIRTGYLHPVYSPSGKVITGDYAPDHPHQHGIFFAWTKTSFEGRSPEFWNEKKKAGKIHYEATDEIRNHGESAGFSVRHRWEDLQAPEAPRSVLSELWSIDVRIVDGSFVFDLISEQKCSTENSLTIEQYHYGGMAVRGNPIWLGDKDKIILTSEGSGRIEGNHTRPSWVRMEGEIDGSPCGILAIPSPENFRAPQWVRLHPTKPYFVFAPMVEEGFELNPGMTYRSAFRFVVYDGRMTEERVEKFLPVPD